MQANHKLDRDTMLPQQALDLLIEGNERFINNIKTEHDMISVREELKDKQQPFASILGCSDSRTTVELVFDQNLGDIFSVRLAGNIASKMAIGSLEFSTEYLGAKIIVVMGHSNCGAVKAACDHFTGGNIGEIIQLINPSVEKEKTILAKQERTSKNNNFVDKVCALNVRSQTQKIVSESTVIQRQIEKKQVGVIGGVYNLASGRVNFDMASLIL